MVDWSKQLYWEDVKVDDEIPAIANGITIQRLVMEAGANRDFAPIHHNREIAQGQGAPDMYANNMFIQGMLERMIREYIGAKGRLRKLGPFRMGIFNCAGDTVTTKGKVVNKIEQNGEKLVELQVWCENSQGISVGPSPAVVSLPSKG
ncbi:MAG: acyl dehydratase [Chloroflexota bacterium]|nr:acyl dehydratase [Chloroflexota bacterium]